MPLYRKVLKPINNTFITEEITNEYTVISINESDISSNIPILEDELLETDDLIVLRGGNAYKLALEFFPFEVGIPSEPQILFTPNDINTSLWLDASDTNTVLTNNNEVIEWLDKSGNGRHLSQSNSALRPTITTVNGLNSLSFSSGKGLQFTSSAALDLFRNRLQAHIFVVAEPTKASGQGALFYYSVGGGNTFVRVYLDLTAPQTRLVARRLDGDTAAAIVIPSTGLRLVASHFNWQNNQLSGWSNQNENSTSISSSGSTANTSSSFAYIGLFHNTPTFNYTGTLSEMIVITDEVSVDLIQKIKGYLAHKHSLTQQLPVDSPYIINPPYQ